MKEAFFKYSKYKSLTVSRICEYFLHICDCLFSFSQLHFEV